MKISARKKHAMDMAIKEPVSDVRKLLIDEEHRIDPVLRSELDGLLRDMALRQVEGVAGELGVGV